LVIPIFRDLPITSFPSQFLLPSGVPLTGSNAQPVYSGSNQLIFWATLIPEGQPETASAQRLPVIVDSGFGDTLLIQQEQLDVHVGIPSRLLEPMRSPRGHRMGIRLASGAIIPKYRVNLLAYPSLPGQRDQPDASAAPAMLRLATGVGVLPPRSALASRFRLPLLGMLGLREAGLSLEIDGARGLAQLSA
jgi:hypothetical protein